MAVKLSKESKNRITRMSSKDRNTVLKAAALLADSGVISAERYKAVERAVGRFASR